MRSGVWLATLLLLVACDSDTTGGGTSADNNFLPADAGNNGPNNGTNNGANNGTNNGVNNDTNNGETDAGDVGTDAPDTDAGEECLALAFEGDQSTRPVDIVWVVDASPSMQEEIDTIEARLNEFAARIGASGLDYRVVMIAADQEYCDDGKCFFDVCVPPPLSGADTCPDADSQRYLHVRRGVHSSDGLDIAIASYPEWGPFLRAEADALVHMVFVTDDDAGWGADAEDFTSFVQSATNPSLPGGVTFHSIVDLVGYDPDCVFDDNCSCGEERGQTYIDLSEATGGLVQSVCQEDWTGIFEALEERVMVGTAIPCTFELPEPEEGQQLDPDQVNVALLNGDGERELVPGVGTEDNCARTDGWFYDDPLQPTRITLCDEVCSRVTNGVEIQIGCATVKGP